VKVDFRVGKRACIPHSCSRQITHLELERVGIKPKVTHAGSHDFTHLIPTVEEPEFLSNDIQSHLNASVMVPFMRMSDDQIREEMLTREQNRMILTEC